MTAKTCEEYVLEKLEETEKKLDYALESVEELTDAVAQAQKILNTVRNRLKVRILSGDSGYEVYFDCPWEKYDKEDFDAIVNAFKLEIPTPEDESDDNSEEEN